MMIYVMPATADRHVAEGGLMADAELRAELAVAGARDPRRAPQRLNPWLEIMCF